MLAYLSAKVQAPEGTGGDPENEGCPGATCYVLGCLNGSAKDGTWGRGCVAVSSCHSRHKTSPVLAATTLGREQLVCNLEQGSVLRMLVDS